MNEDVRTSTRRGLHAVAEYVLAGPQFRDCGSIRLRVTPGGFSAATASHAHVERVELVSPSGRLPIDGATCAGLAAAAGVEASHLREVYPDGPDLGIDDVLAIDEGAAAEIVAAFERGDAALRSLVPEGSRFCGPNTSTSASPSARSTSGSRRAI